MDKLEANYRDVASLDDETRRSMFALFERYYSAVSATQFEKDLAGKSIVILLTDDSGAVHGFSTIEVIPFETASGPAIALFSGDTIISHHYWGDHRLARAWCFFAGQIKYQRPDLPLYWFLIVKGHRTYRYLPAFTRRYYPSYERETPPDIQNVIDRLATRKFADYYQPDRGILHFPESRGHLRHEWAAPAEDLAQRPNVAFFLEKNPGYLSGDELVCLTELRETNMRFVSRIAFLEGMNSCQHGVIFDLSSRASAAG